MCNSRNLGAGASRLGGPMRMILSHIVSLQLSEMTDNLDSEEVMSLLTKITEVQLLERKELLKNSKVATDETDDSLEDSFRQRVMDH